MKFKSTLLTGLASIFSLVVFSGSAFSVGDSYRPIKTLTCQDTLSDTTMQIKLIEPSEYSTFPDVTVPEDTLGEYAWGTLVRNGVTERFAGRFLVELRSDRNLLFYFVGGQGRGEDLIKFKAADWSKIYGGVFWKKVSDRSILDGFCEAGY